MTVQGLASGIQQQVSAHVQGVEPPLRGLRAGETIWVTGPSTTNPSQFLTIRGRVHAAGGTSRSLALDQARIDGVASIGDPHRTPFSWSMPAYDAPHAEGFYVPGMAGYGISGSGIQTLPGLAEQFSQPPQPLTPMPLPGSAEYGLRSDPAGLSAATAPAQCTATAAFAGGGGVAAGHVQLSAAQQVTIGDGHALDLSGPGDGQIVMCQQSIALRGDSHLTFTAPATLYVVGTSPPSPSTVTTGGSRNRAAGPCRGPRR